MKKLKNTQFLFCAQDVFVVTTISKQWLITTTIRTIYIILYQIMKATIYMYEDYLQTCINEFTTMTAIEYKNFKQIMKIARKKYAIVSSERQYFVDILGDLQKTRDLEKWREFVRENYGHYKNETLFGKIVRLGDIQINDNIIK